MSLSAVNRVTADHDLIGQPIDAIDTPAMVVDFDILESNLKQMAEFFSARSCQIRPHFKSHKCIELARRQLAIGSAGGITCAKLSEAEQLVAGGIDDVLIANQVVGQRKAARLAELNRRATVRCAVDSIENIIQLNQQASHADVKIGVLVEVDIGMHRCGVAPGQETLNLARQVNDQSHLRFDGLQGYEGHLVNIFDFEQKRVQTSESIRLLTDTRARIEQAGIDVPIVSGGSSSTYQITGVTEGIDELQCGSYALMDWVYHKLCPEFAVARTILASVISRGRDHVVVDVGLKGMGCDFGPPMVADHPDATVRYTAEEHMPIDQYQAEIGSQVHLIPSHGCTTNSLYQQMWITRGRQIIDRWQIEGSGCLE